MLITLDIDDRVLAAARARASAESISLGQAVSLLAQQALDQAPHRFDGFPVFDPVDGHTVTDAMVSEHREQGR